MTSSMYPSSHIVPKCLVFINMLRLQPTAVRLTPSELKDIENRSRYRRYLRQQQHGPLFAAKVTTRSSATRADNAIVQEEKHTEESIHGQGDEQTTSSVGNQTDEDDYAESSPDPLQDSDPLHHPPLRSVRRGVLFHHQVESGKSCLGLSIGIRSNDG